MRRQCGTRNIFSHIRVFILTEKLRHWVGQVLPSRISTRLARISPATVQLPGGRFKMVTANGDPIAGAMWWHGLSGREPETLRVWSRLAPTADFVIDVGANTGVYALSAAAMSSALTLALEPVPMIATELRRNVSLNDFRNVVVIEKAVADKAGTGILHLPDDGLTTEASLLEGFRPSKRSIPVPLTTIDELVEIYQLSGEGLIKIDTEATEHTVLHGASTVMDSIRPVIIVEVLPGRNEELLQEILEQHDYASLWLGSMALPERGLVGASSEATLNWVLAPRERVLFVRQCTA